MFLARNVKKFLKKTLQESEKADQDLIKMVDGIEHDCALDSNNTATSPAYHNLIGNCWHCLGKDD